MVTLYDFYADWCGPCKIMRPVFEELEKTYAGKVTFTKIDVDADGTLAGQYGVMSIPTFIAVRDGKELSRKIGAMPKDTLKTWIDSLL